MRKFLTLLAALLIALPLSLPASAEQNPGQPPTLYAVSYTHLTLPTILRV